MIPKKYKKFQPLKDSKNKEWTKTYSHIKSQLTTTSNLIIITGKHGTGKTQMISSLSLYTKRKLNLTAKYINFTDFIIDILDSQSRGNIKQSITKYKNYNLLCFDAFELRKASNFENRMFNLVIDSRYAEEKNTIITTNDDINTVSEGLGTAIMDRFKEIGTIYNFDWKGLR